MRAASSRPAGVARRPGLRARRPPAGDPRRAAGPFPAHARLRVRAALRQGSRCVPQRIAGRAPGRAGACGALRAAAEGAGREPVERVTRIEAPHVRFAEIAPIWGELELSWFDPCATR